MAHSFLYGDAIEDDEVEGAYGGDEIDGAYEIDGDYGGDEIDGVSSVAAEGANLLEDNLSPDMVWH